MKNIEIEKILFKLLKSKSPENVYYTILQIGNNTYNFENNKIKEVPYERLILHLEKVISLVTNFKGSFNDIDSSLNAIQKFCNVINNTNIKKLRSNKLISLKYDTEIALCKLKGLSKKRKIQIMSLVLGTAIFFTLASQINKRVESSLEDKEIVIEVPTTSNIIDDMIDYPNEITALENEQFEIGSEYSDIDIIKDKYNITEDEFKIIAAIIMAESDGTYLDTYAVASTILNRCNDISCNWCGGENPFLQATHPSQFVVYENGRYLSFLETQNGDSYQAVVDCFKSGESNHNYLCYRSNKTDFTNMQVGTPHKFTPTGNQFFQEMNPENYRGGSGRSSG